MPNVPDSFLKGDTTTTVVDFAPFADAEEIGDKCLCWATAVTEIRNLHLLSKVRKIGATFLFGNRMSPAPIKAIDLSAFTLVTEMGKDCIGNTCIVHIDLTGLRNVVKVGSWFLHGNKQLESVDFSTWTKCEEIGMQCLSDCTALRAVNLAGFAVSLKKISYQFLGDTGDNKNPFLTQEQHLDQVDLSPLLNVPATTIYDDELNKAIKRVRGGGANDGLNASKRRPVNLVMYKSKSRLGAMLASHFVPRRLVLHFVAPPEFVAPKPAKPASAM